MFGGWHALRYSEGRGQRPPHALRSTSGRATHPPAPRILATPSFDGVRDLGVILANRWWIYQRERFPIVAHGPLVGAFSLSAVCCSSLLRGEVRLPSGRTAV